MNIARIFSLLGIPVLLTATAGASTIHVPADQPTIQAGIDAAISGDTVLVADGTYTGTGNRDIDFGGKGVVLKSENGPDVTIIDCQGTENEHHRGFSFHSGEDSTAVVDGFTIRGGYGHYSSYGPSVGGGISCSSSSSPKIVNNNIDGNFAIWGGGIFCDSSGPTISTNTISGNTSKAHGGGIKCDYSSSLKIINNHISGNSAGVAGGGISCFISSPTISANIISNNSAAQAAGIDCYVSDPEISDNLISGNSSSRDGAGIRCHLSNPTLSGNTISSNSGAGLFLKFSSYPLLEHTIIAFNSGAQAVYCDDTIIAPPLICCDIFGNDGGDWVGCIASQAGTKGNFSADPLFCAGAYGDYHLSPSSPCLPGSNVCRVLIGAFGAGCVPVAFPGDVNCDSLLDLTDVILIGNVLDGLIDLTGTCSEGADDVNQDGVVTQDDYNLLYDIVAGTGP